MGLARPPSAGATGPAIGPNGFGPMDVGAPFIDGAIGPGAIGPIGFMPCEPLINGFIELLPCGPILGLMLGIPAPATPATPGGTGGTGHGDGM
jgi:hypothetical protein